MRLKTLTLRHFGNFEDQRVTFDPAPDRINVLVLPNGGGKTMMRHAFCDLLFGIHGQSPFGWRFGYPGMRLVAEALDQDGVPFIFGRRKGQGRTLLDQDGQPAEETLIRQRLGGLDRARLNRLFVMDTAELRRAEQQLLATDGELGSALVSAAGGVMNLRALKTALTEARDQIAPLRRSAGRPFYQQADAYAAARRRKDDHTLRPQDWERKKKDCDAAVTAQAEANLAADEALAGIAKLERIRRTRKHLADHAEAETWLLGHPDAPVLDPGLADRLKGVRETLATAAFGVDQAREAVQRTGRELDAAAVDDAIMAEADAIGHLVSQAGAARKARSDLPAVEAALTNLTGQISEALRQLGLDLPVERAGEAVPTRTVIARVRKLIQTAASLRALVQAVPATIARRQQECDDLREQLATLPAAGDLSGLSELLREIRVDGDPANRLRQAEQAKRAAYEQVATALALVPGWTGTADTLLALPLLPVEFYERPAKELADAARDAAERGAGVEKALQDRDAARERLLMVEGPTPLPDAGRLARERARRDQGWDLVKRRAFGSQPPSSAEEAEFAGPFTLPIAYERAVLQTDETADRRVDQAQQIADAEAARKTLTDAEAALERTEQQARAAREREAALRRAWQQLCAPMGLGENPPIEAVRRFIQTRDAALAKRSVLVAADLAVLALLETQKAWLARLGRALGRDEQDLTRLLEEADRRVAAADQAGRTRAGLAGRLESAQSLLTEARDQARRTEAEHATWRAEWGRAMAEMRRPASEDPETAEEIVRLLEALDRDNKDRIDRASRVKGMHDDISHFTADVRMLAGRVAPDMATEDPFAAVVALGQRLGVAKAADTLRAERQAQAVAARTALEMAENRLRGAQSDRAAILAAIGADTEDSADQRLSLAQTRALQAGRLGEAAAQLREHGDGLPLDTLRADAGAVSPDALPGQMEALGAQAATARQTAQDAAALVAMLTGELREAETATIVNEAAAQQQAAVAALGRLLEDAIVHHIAADMLDRAITTVEANEAPEALRRINVDFEALTNGAYARIQAEPRDDGQAHLFLVQSAFPDEQQAVRDLSEGTRDQLFLALRLAAIKAYVQDSPALPFIGDDILQTFDDDRAAAAMRVLCDASRDFQVILLTHHRHLLDVASRLPNACVHVCQVSDI
jgi:uncharacterized protein YhaN